jgi:hypothetical protein
MLLIDGRFLWIGPASFSLKTPLCHDEAAPWDGFSLRPVRLNHKQFYAIAFLIKEKKSHI